VKAQEAFEHGKIELKSPKLKVIKSFVLKLCSKFSWQWGGIRYKGSKSFMFHVHRWRVGA